MQNFPFVVPGDPSHLIHGSYPLLLVLLSVGIAIFTSVMAMQIAGMARRTDLRLHRHVAVLSGALTLGAGIWAMHFVGTLALRIGTVVNYSPGLTWLSVLPGLGSAWVVLALLVRARVTRWQLVFGSLLVGSGIETMHYMGTAAMQMSPLLRHDPLLFAMSSFLNAALVMLILSLRLGGEGRGWLVDLIGERRSGVPNGIFMGLAMAGMHYTSVMTERFANHADPAVASAALNSDFVAAVVAVIVIVVTLLAVAANALLRMRELFLRLKDNESRMQTVFETIADGLLTVDVRGTVVSLNAAAERIFGWSASEIVGGPDDVLFPDQATADAHHARLRAFADSSDGRSRVREAVIRHKDGHHITVRSAAGRIYAGDKALFVIALSDISEQQAMERALRDSEQQLRALIGNMPGVCFRATRCEKGAPIPWQAVFLSEAVTAMTGYEPEEFTVRGRAWRSMLDPDDIERVAAERQTSAREGRSYEVLYRIRTRDGSVRWVWETGKAHLDEQGVAQALDGVVFDVTENRLRNAEFESIVDALRRSLVVVEFDLEGRTLNANDNSLRLSGYTLEEFCGRAHAEDWGESPDAPSPALTDFWARLRRGEYISGEFQRFGKNGKPFWIQATYNPIYGPDGSLQKIMCFAKDITARKHMEGDLREAKARAEQAAAARAAFTANMSHEIRTPMNAILGFTDVLLDGELAHEQRRHLETVRSASHNLLSLLNDVLDTAKLDRGAVELVVEEFNLRALIVETSATLAGGLRSKGLRFALHYDEQLVSTYRGDALRVRQILTNLLDNAIKFTERGEVTLSVRPGSGGDAGALHFTVRDTGIGIASDRLASLFDPFVQADASMSRRFGGTGLGTTISKQLVELMGGRIWVESQPGVGSAFHFVLPLAAVAQAAPPPGLPHDTPRLPPLHILVVDDAPQNRQLLGILLSPHGHTVTQAEGGESAMALTAEARFDLILMDVQMPDVDGLETTRRIRAREQREGRPRVPVIALTASVMKADREAASAAGMDGFASKPVDLSVLNCEMARVLGLGGAAHPAPASVSRTLRALDAHTAQRRWGGKRADFVRILLRFAGELPAAFRTLATHAAQQRPAEARNEAHRLRGVAANLGLDSLAAALAGFEAACAAAAQEATRSAELDAALQAVERAQGEALAAIDAETAPDRARLPVAVQGKLDVAALGAAAAALMHAMSRGELDEEAARALAAALPAGHPALATLQEHLDDFNFAAAQACLAELLSSLQDTSEVMPS
ncbi:MAG TPA: PAS domain S-box protein [Rhodocyclaceae bacterium]|nr:PAS domain S-box protein [Rhodocyclaceae bacterium]